MRGFIGIAIDPDEVRTHIETLTLLRDAARAVESITSTLHAPFVSVRYDNGIAVTIDDGEVTIAQSEVGLLKLTDLEMALAHWSGERPYDCRARGHLVAEGAGACMLCGAVV